MLLIGTVAVGLLLLGFPIYALLLATAILLLLGMQVPWSAIHQVLYGSVDRFSLLAVPFFIFAGELMARGSMSVRIIDAVMAIIGGRRDAMPLTTIGASTIFGSLNGSSPATVAAIGRLMYPALREQGYSERFSAGLITSSGGIAAIIPPSIAIILYGVSSGQSVSQLFIAGILPGLFLSLLLAIYIAVYLRHAEAPKDGFRLEMPRVARAWLRGFWAILTPVIILGGIYSGLFTPTEAAGVACVYALFVTLVIYRDLSLSDVWNIALESAVLTGQIMIIVATAGVFSWLLTVQGIPQQIVATISALDVPAWSLMLTINLFLLIVGCFVDPVSAILVLTPLLVPIATSLGVDPVHFGIIVTINLSIGMFSPPFGLNIFVAQATLNVPAQTIYRGVLPFMAVYIVGLLIITVVPELSLFFLNR